MGCDIHYVIEQEHDGEWVGVFGTDNYLTYPNYDARRYLPALMFKDRNYQFFTRLASVRGPGPTPRGLPEDLSSMSRMYTDNWDADGHSYSYASLRDFVSAWLASDGENIVPIVKKKLEGNDPVLEVLKELGICQYEEDPNIDKYRVVFWFDN
jgi:hypothetical protein